MSPKDIKRVLQDCWAVSDSRNAFAQALVSQGLVLARGDRRGYVAVDYHGEVSAITKYTGVRTKAVWEKLGDPENLPSVEQAKAQIADSMSDKLKRPCTKQKKTNNGIQSLLNSSVKNWWTASAPNVWRSNKSKKIAGKQKPMSEQNASPADLKVSGIS